MKGRVLDSHDYVFWCGDFNYRIDLLNEQVKDLIKLQDWNTLLNADQLKVQQLASQVFQDFTEGVINFAPTYKYDVFSDDYDTSEKNRIPSWTDRVLYKQKKFMNEEINAWLSSKIIRYGRAELKTSDHRPVIAYIDIDVLQVDKAKRLSILQGLLTSGPQDATVIVTFRKDDDLIDAGKEIEACKALWELFKENAIYMRPVKNTLWVTFVDGKSALRALDHNGSMVEHFILNIVLKTPDWTTEFYKELKLCRNNTIPLFCKNFDHMSLTDSPLNELGSSKEDLINKEVLSCLNLESCNGISEDYIDVEDEDQPKSQSSSGRSSPVRGSKSLGNLPPRPPPPSQHGHRKAASLPPERPPPPRPGPPIQAEKKTTAINEDLNYCGAKSDHNAETKISEQNVAETSKYRSCPPPTMPPPPPPPSSCVDENMSHSSKTIQGSLSSHSDTSVLANSSLKQPPPIPLRPKSTSIPSVNQPPPIPARAMKNSSQKPASLP